MNLDLLRNRKNSVEINVNNSHDHSIIMGTMLWELGYKIINSCADIYSDFTSVSTHVFFQVQDPIHNPILHLVVMSL